MIEIRNINKSFGKKEVLKDVSMTLEPGKVYGFLGNNGAGKTTLMRTIFNMVIPNGGTITYNGIPQKKINYSNWYYFTEKDVVPTSLSVSKYLKDIALLAKLPMKEYKKRKNIINNYVNTNFKLSRKIKKLSSGQQKVVGSLALLMLRPDVIFLDEPTANMDVRNQQFVLDIVKELRNENRIVVITTHLLKEIKDSLTDIVILDKGRITYSAPLSGKDNVEDIFEKYTTPESKDANYKGMTKKQIKKAKKREAKEQRIQAKIARKNRSINQGETQVTNVVVDTASIKKQAEDQAAIDDERLERYLNEK